MEYAQCVCFIGDTQSHIHYTHTLYTLHTHKQEQQAIAVTRFYLHAHKYVLYCAVLGALVTTSMKADKVDIFTVEVVTILSLS